MSAAETERLFSAMVRAVRQKRNLTQDELAARLLVSQSRISQIESGREALLESTLEDIAAALGLSMRQFLAEGLRLTAHP